MTPIRIVILSRSSLFGLGQDAKLLEQVLREITIKNKRYTIISIDHLDPLQFVGGRRPQSVEVQIHLEQPCRAAMPWAQTNLLVVNPEWWATATWQWALRPVAEGGMNQFLFKSNAAKGLFPEVADRSLVLYWRAPPIDLTPVRKIYQAIFIVGGSINKLEAAKQLIPWWTPAYPPLTVYGSTETVASLPSPPLNVTYRPGYLPEDEKQRIQQLAMYHVVASAAEGFGYTYAECAKIGSVPIWTALPVYEELWGSAVGAIGKIAVTPNPASTKRDAGYTFTEAAFRTAMESIATVESFPALQTLAHNYTTTFRQGWRRALILPPSSVLPVLPPAPPPILPTVAVITLTHNRKKWWTNMAENILRSTYPKEKIVWVVLDDSVAEERVDRQVQQFQEAHSSPRLIYQSLPKKLSIGEKRNMGVEVGIINGCTLFMNMDDDDYYPPSSIVARV